MSRIPAKVVNEVYGRAGADLTLAGNWPHCEGCGYSAATHRVDLHHRDARGMGGSRRDLDTTENIVLLHHTCHMHIHAHPDLGRRLGLIIETGVDPASVPVTPVRNLLELVA